MQANVIDKVKFFFFFLNKAGIAFLSYKGELFRAQVPNLWAMDHFCQISAGKKRAYCPWTIRLQSV